MSSSSSPRNAPLRSRIILASAGLSGLLFAALIVLQQVQLPLSSWVAPALLALTWVALAWLAMLWSTALLRRSLREARDGLGELARTGEWPAQLGVSGVREVDTCLEPVRRAHEARTRALETLREAVRDLSDGRPIARSLSGMPAEFAGLAGDLDAAGAQLDGRAQALKASIRRVYQDGADPVKVLAEMPAEHRHHPMLAEVLGQLQDGNARLMSSVREMTNVVERNSTTLAELAWQAKSVSQAMSSLAASGAQAASSSQLLAENSARVSSEASQVGGLAQKAQDNSQLGQRELLQTITAMRTMGEHTQQASTSITRLQDSSRKIEHIVQLIREIADKVNLLSLNAAIEAARAGEHGRGFAVVAQEVRNLAEKTFHATKEIDASVGGIMSETQHAVERINALLTDVQANVQQIEQVGQRLNGILDFSSVLSSQMGGIVSASEESARKVHSISDYLMNIQQELTSFGQRIEEQESQIVSLTELGEGFFDQLVELRFESTHSRMYAVARGAADAVQQVFQQAVAQGRLRRDDLMSRHYEPIPGTNPPKFRSRFDAFTDQVLPTIQEQVLRDHPAIVFAICTDKGGYVPTHNDKFAKPPTGNYEVDLVQSRSKRIFSDRTGSRCGSHTKKLLLQTYKRDTGEIMHDLSVPIYVDGVHWGGFRMGYKAH